MKHRGKFVFLAGFGFSLAAGWFVFPMALYERTSQPLQFNHAVHVGEKAGMACADCHQFRDDGTFAGIPTLENCAGCHAEPLGETQAEKILVEQFVKPGLEIPWLIYSRQPENVFFSHASHVKLGEVKCEECHGDHGKTTSLRPFERNRISGYSRDIWGPSLARVGSKRPGMKMDDCISCHRDHGLNHSCLGCHK
jgi:menaquinone reductase, multiheme cytochrome c subunit